VASIIAWALLALTIAGCETTSVRGPTGEARAEWLAANGQHADAAGVYIGLATERMGEDRARLTLLAVEQWLDAGDTKRARSAFLGVERPRTEPLAWLWKTNQATLFLYRGRADDALDLLEPLSQRSLPLRYRLRVDVLRADAWIQQQNPARAVELMTQRESWLTDPADIESNRWRLWQGLLVSQQDALRDGADAAGNPEVKGWLQLASLAASTGQQGNAWLNGAARWRDANANHPAMLIIAQMQLPDEVLPDYPRNIALLLPLSGRNARAGEAIQNGFLGAYFATAPGQDDPPTIRVYDVVEEGGASAAYNAAFSDGAEFVVGPLLRSNVVELANDTLVPVPVLTLNYLPEDTLAPPGLYQFALAPEDEARSAAYRAIADGHTRAVALVPGNDWGRRVLRSFASELEALGGTLLDQRTYTTGIQDFSSSIEELMGLSASTERYQRLRANLGTALEFEPRRRQDSEFIFLAADAPAGRLLKSQLKFHYSGDLPVYSTSFIYAMDGRSNADLDGIMFADTPWVIRPQSEIAELPQLYSDFWPEQRRLSRLHAMGYDAYNLVAALYAARIEPMQAFDGATGRLMLDPDGRVRRGLVWAQFRRGEPVALPDTEPVDQSTPEGSAETEFPAPEVAEEAPWNEGAIELEL
jgi:outer membrane PBP1 activator LpoA protein